MKYNGLKNDFTSFAKFVFIFEKKIKTMTKNAEFKSCFVGAFKLYEHKMKCHVRNVTSKEIDVISEYAKYTLFFTKSKNQILDFCRYLRNSFVHALLRKEQHHLIIADSTNKKKISSKGYLDYSLVMGFIQNVVKEYNNK